MAICALTAIPFAVGAQLQVDMLPLLALLALALLFASAALAINPGATMAMMPSWACGVATALGVLIVNVIGLGGGPFAVALLNDRVFGDPDALPGSLAITTGSSLIAATLCAWRCRTPYAKCLSRSAKRRRGLPRP